MSLARNSARPPVWLSAAAMAALWGALYGVARWISLFVANPVHVDFRIFYVAAQAGLEHGWASIYDIPTLEALSAGFPEAERYINSSATYVSAPLLAWLIAPLTVFPVPVAYGMWTAVSAAALVWAWSIAAPYRGLSKFALLLLALALWPVMDSLYYGQPTLLVLALVAAVYRLCEQDRPIAAGLVLAFATALKPQVVILVAPALLVSGRYRATLGWVAGIAVIGAVSAAVLGSTGLTSWSRAIQYVQGDPGHSFFTMARLFGAGYATYALEAGLGAAAVVAAWRQRARVEVVIAIALLGSLASAFHLHQPDYAILVLAAWLVLRASPPPWHRGWLVLGVVTMQLITLGQPIPQLLWDVAWLGILLFSSFGGSGESAPATRAPAGSAARAGT